MIRSQRVSHHILTCARGVDLWAVGEAADDGHAGKAGGGRGAEGLLLAEEDGEAGGDGGEGGAEGG